MLNGHLMGWNIGILEEWNDGFKQVKKEVLLILALFHHSIHQIRYCLFSKESFRSYHQYNRHHDKDNE